MLFDNTLSIFIYYFMNPSSEIEYSGNIYILLGVFFANGEFLDNSYLYFNLYDKKKSIDSEYSSDLLYIDYLISKEFKIQYFKKVKSKKEYSSIYYNSGYFKNFLLNFFTKKKVTDNFYLLNDNQMLNISYGLKTAVNKEYLYNIILYKKDNLKQKLGISDS